MTGSATTTLAHGWGPRAAFFEQYPYDGPVTVFSHACAEGEDVLMQPRNMSMSGVVDLAAVKAAGEAKAKAEQARAESARTGGGGAVAPPAW